VISFVCKGKNEKNTGIQRKADNILQNENIDVRVSLEQILNLRLHNTRFLSPYIHVELPNMQYNTLTY